MCDKTIYVNLLNFSSPNLAGAGVFTKNLLKAWLQRRNDMRLVLLHNGAIDVFETFDIQDFQNCVRSISVPTTNFVLRILFEQLILPFIIPKGANYFSPTPALPFLTKLLNRRTKIIITIHDMIPFFVPRKYGITRSYYIKFLSKYGAKLANHVITVSENSKHDISKITNISLQKITVVYNFSELVFMENNVKDGHYFISISTIEPGKNIENTMQGFKIFNGSLPLERKYKFYWIGQIGWGYTRGGLNNMIDEAGLTNDFILTGFIDDFKKNKLIENSTALVYLSHYEGFGLPILEAFIFNKPSMVSNTSSLPEVVGKAGIVCDKEDLQSIASAFQEISHNRYHYQKEIPTQIHKFSPVVQIENFLGAINSYFN